MDSARQSLLRDFFKDGYVIIPGLFNRQEVGLISGCFDRLEATALQLGRTCLHRGSQFVVEGEAIHRVVWACGAEPKLKPLGTKDKLIQTVAALLGSKSMDHLICQSHFKRPGDMVEFPFHQDAEHRHYGTTDWRDISGRGSYIQTITAVDPMDTDNGPVLIQPGSHTDGYLDLGSDNNRNNLVRRECMIPLQLAPGSVVCFGPYLIHGSRPNQSDRSRRIFINGFASPGANNRTYPGEGSGYRLTVASR